ncbi:hypothetical protein ScPMuIL_011968 [Solemya velum]
MDIYDGLTDISYLAHQLEDRAVLADSSMCRNLIGKILSKTMRGEDVSALHPQLLKLLAHPDMVIKKMACQVMIETAVEGSELIILAINTLLQDCRDSNPILRGIAIKTLCSLKHPAFTEYGIKVAQHGLSDQNAYVRRSSVLGCTKIFHQDKMLPVDHGLVDELYSILRDCDPIVVMNALVSLEEILQSEGGIVFNKNIVHHLLNKFSTFTTWGQAYILKLLQKYVPKNEDEIFDILNILDSYLSHSNLGVLTNTLELFLHILQGFPHLQMEVYKKSLDSLLWVLGSGNAEISFTMIEFIEKYLTNVQDLFFPHFKSFFCRYKDPIYLKEKKISIFPKLVTKDNVEEILDELSMYSTVFQQEVSLAAMKAMAKIVENQPDLADSCLSKFGILLQSEVGHIISNILQVLQTLDLSRYGDLQALMTAACSRHAHLVDNEEGQCALLWLISEYGATVDEAPYIIEDYLENFGAKTPLKVKLHLMTVTLKLFFHQPAQCQSILGELLEKCLADSNTEVQLQALFYF